MSGDPLTTARIAAFGPKTSHAPLHEQEIARLREQNEALRTKILELIDKLADFGVYDHH